MLLLVLVVPDRLLTVSVLFLNGRRDKGKCCLWPPGWHNYGSCRNGCGGENRSPALLLLSFFLFPTKHVAASALATENHAQHQRTFIPIDLAKGRACHLPIG